MSTVEKMSVHKALAELKIIDSRIEKAIYNGEYCKANKHSNEKIDGRTIKETREYMIGCFDKASDLMKRRNAIKEAVVLSNAITKTPIGDREYTVAEAIWMKNHGMEYYSLLLQELKSQYAQSKAVVERENGKSLSDRADKFVVDMYGTKDQKISNDDMDKARKSFIEANTYDLIDPLDIQKKIDELEAKISEFMAEVDAALSVSNATTEITIEY